jgi:hypothetical protein
VPGPISCFSIETRDVRYGLRFGDNARVAEFPLKTHSGPQTDHERDECENHRRRSCGAFALLP